MTQEEISGAESAENQSVPENGQDVDDTTDILYLDSEEERPCLASAKDFPRPATNLINAPRGPVDDLVLSLAPNVLPGPGLEKIQEINTKPNSQTRTPLMTVIQAIIRSHGGSTRLSQLCDEVDQHWNRLFPTTPYSKEEFIYIMVESSDSVRISE
ncbi:hypothetical protein ACFL2Q_11245 [Thermodesulfobacteriota bacterium]